MKLSKTPQINLTYFPPSPEIHFTLRRKRNLLPLQPTLWTPSRASCQHQSLYDVNRQRNARNVQASIRECQRNPSNNLMITQKIVALVFLNDLFSSSSPRGLIFYIIYLILNSFRATSDLQSRRVVRKHTSGDKNL